jgi:hypothetical protein
MLKLRQIKAKRSTDLMNFSPFLWSVLLAVPTKRYLKINYLQISGMNGSEL